jgi:hypothetical protein
MLNIWIKNKIMPKIHNGIRTGKYKINLIMIIKISHYAKNNYQREDKQ